MSKKYLRLPKPIKDYPAEEIRALLSALKISVLMRTIIIKSVIL